MRIIGLIILCLLPVSGFTQNPTRINGKAHPELIPDTAAYRAVFLMQSHSATPEEIARSEQFHARVGLSQADHDGYHEVLARFRERLDKLVAAHDAFMNANASANMADLSQESTGFRQSLSALVQETRNHLRAAMTDDGFAKLDAFVQSEKAHMTVGVRSVQ